MFETTAEVDRLQEILDASLAGATQHLKGIIDEDRSLRATEILGLMSGMRTLSLATVTAREEARISAVDGHLLHGRWVFTTSRSSAKARQLKARPGVSASYLEGEALGVFTHGEARQIVADDEEYRATLDYLTDFYSSSPLSWGDVALYRIEPTWMVGYASDRDALLVGRGLVSRQREQG